MAEDVLVWHLNTECSLRSDAAHSVTDVNCVDVGETLRAYVHCDERTCNNRTVSVTTIIQEVLLHLSTHQPKLRGA